MLVLEARRIEAKAREVNGKSAVQSRLSASTHSMQAKDNIVNQVGDRIVSLRLDHHDRRRVCGDVTPFQLTHKDLVDTAAEEICGVADVDDFALLQIFEIIVLGNDHPDFFEFRLMMVALKLPSRRASFKIQLSKWL